MKITGSFHQPGVFPYLPESEIATVSRDLPQGIQERGRESGRSCPSMATSMNVAISYMK
jgi:hypothetical protein